MVLAPPTLREEREGAKPPRLESRHPRTTPGSVGGRGGRDGREAERPSFPGSRTTRKYCRRTRKGRVIREEAGGVTRTRRAHVIAPTDGGRQERHGRVGTEDVNRCQKLRVYRVRSGVHARRSAANIARVADALLFVLARVFARRRSRTALSSTRPRCDLKSEASGAKLSKSANEKQFSEKNLSVDFTRTRLRAKLCTYQ